MHSSASGRVRRGRVDGRIVSTNETSRSRSSRQAPTNFSSPPLRSKCSGPSTGSPLGHGPPPVEGVMDGDVHLVGGGDPLLTSDDYPIGDDRYPAFNTTSFGALADARRGGHHLDPGSILGDGSRYDDETRRQLGPGRRLCRSRDRTTHSSPTTGAPSGERENSVTRTPRRRGSSPGCSASVASASRWFGCRRRRPAAADSRRAIGAARRRGRGDADHERQRHGGNAAEGTRGRRLRVGRSRRG